MGFFVVLFLMLMLAAFFLVPRDREQTLQIVNTGPKLSLIKDTNVCVLFSWTSFTERNGFFMCVSSLFPGNNLGGTESGLTAANGICMGATCPANSPKWVLILTSLVPRRKLSHVSPAALHIGFLILRLGLFWLFLFGLVLGGSSLTPFNSYLSVTAISLILKASTNWLYG